MQIRALVIFLGLGLLAISQCSEGRHATRDRRDAQDYNMFAADQGTDDDAQNDENEANRGSESKNEYPITARITTAPQIYEVMKGDNVTLECQVDPKKGIVVDWYKGSELLFVNKMRTVQDTRYSIELIDSSNVTIQNLTASDAGVYKCGVESSPVKVEHTLIVLQAPEIINFTASNSGKVVEGQDLELTCEVISMPPPTFIWSRIRVNQDANERLSAGDGEFLQNRLVMRGVTPDLAGTYYCYVCNKYGCDQKELRVDITPKPHVHVHKAVVNSAIGVEAVLECATRFAANPHMRWYKDGKLIEDSSTDYVISTSGTRSNLTVKPDADDDFGTFTCEAENDIGRHNRSIELVQRPVIESLRADKARLSFTVHSHRPLLDLRAQILLIEEGNSEWKELVFPPPSNATASNSYELTYDLDDKQLEAGSYQVFVKANNDHGWSDNIDPVVAEIEVQPAMSVQTASVFRGNDAHSIQAASVFSTFLMYLLVRTL